MQAAITEMAEVGRQRVRPERHCANQSPLPRSRKRMKLAARQAEMSKANHLALLAQALR